MHILSAFIDFQSKSTQNSRFMRIAPCASAKAGRILLPKKLHFKQLYCAE
jgi:hypothetical protein